MTNNIVKLFPEEAPDPTNEEITNEYIGGFLDWCKGHNIDTTTVDFKYDAAVIMTILRSLLHKKATDAS